MAELRALSGGEYGDGHPFRTIRVVPDDVALPPIWLLGSSGASARLAGDDRSISEVAEAFGRAIGRPVQYQQVPWEDYRQAAGEEYYKMYRRFQDVGYNADVQALRGEYPALTDFDTYLRQTGWEGAQPAE